MNNSNTIKNSINYLSNNVDVSVLIPTYNRAGDLRITLDKMRAAERKSLTVEFVIIDNGSTDNTKSVVESFAGHLPIRYLFEPRHGKNYALNFALDKARLGEIIVFTDDDIDPDPNWLNAIVETCKRWPDHSVFGGRIYVVWPHDNIPEWTNDPHIQRFGFMAHDITDHECIYDRRHIPFGANLWVRRDIFANGRRFNETIGPRPKNRIMGSESSFLLKLQDDGYEFVYSPYAIVGHRIQPDVITPFGIWRRAYRLGRSAPHLRGLLDMEQLKQNPFVWKLHRYIAIIRQMFKVFRVVISPFTGKRVEQIVYLIQQIGRDIESLRLARNEEA